MTTLKIVIGACLISVCVSAARAERKVEEHVASNHFNGKVEIDAGGGTLEIIGWDKNEVAITGTIGDGVRQLDIGKGHRKVKVKAIASKEGDEREVHLVLHAPHNNDLSVPFFQGAVKISRIEGDIEVETFSGNIAVIGSCKRVDARSVSGSITFDAGTEDFAADKVHAKTVSGAIVAHKVRREVEAQSISGSVTVTGDSCEKVTIETVSGDVQFTGELAHSGQLRIDTHSGQILGAFAPEFAADFEVTAYNGKVENAFAINDGKHGMSRGDGETRAEVRATSFRGNIRLTKRAKSQAPSASSRERLLR